jgi:hypothetical protein
VDLFAARLVDDDVGEKSDELGRGVPLRGLAQDFACLRIEGGVQGQGAMPVLLKSVPFCASWRERQHRIFAIKRLAALSAPRLKSNGGEPLFAATLSSKLSRHLTYLGGAIFTLFVTLPLLTTACALDWMESFSSCERTTPLSVTLPLTETIFTLCA